MQYRMVRPIVIAAGLDDAAADAAVPGLGIGRRAAARKLASARWVVGLRRLH